MDQRVCFILLTVARFPFTEILSTQTSKGWADERQFLCPRQHFVVELFVFYLCQYCKWKIESHYGFNLHFFCMKLSIFTCIYEPFVFLFGIWDAFFIFPRVLLPGWQSFVRCYFKMYGLNNKVLLYNTENYIQYPMINHNGKEYIF